MIPKSEERRHMRKCTGSRCPYCGKKVHFIKHSGCIWDRCKCGWLNTGRKKERKVIKEMVQIRIEVES